MTVIIPEVNLARVFPFRSSPNTKFTILLQKTLTDMMSMTVSTPNSTSSSDSDDNVQIG